MAEHVVVYGAGSWGTAFALLAANQGLRVTLACRTAMQAKAIGRDGENMRYLAGAALPATVTPVPASEAGAALERAAVVVVALPSRTIVSEATRIAAAMPPDAGLLSLTKGLEPSSGRMLSDVWREALGPRRPYAMLSGPNHAEEVAQRQPSAAVVAGDDALCARLQALFSGDSFRLYTNPDLLGVELCAAAKNVVAIAAGMCDGVGFGDNAKASLITRGLAEMTRLGAAEGAASATFGGLAGMGDLVATCTSRHSRNRRAGELIAQGLAPHQVEQRLGQVAEGLWTVPRLLERAEGHGVELPICAEVAAAVAGKPVLECMGDLMTRAPSAEL